MGSAPAAASRSVSIEYNAMSADLFGQQPATDHRRGRPDVNVMSCHALARTALAVHISSPKCSVRGCAHGGVGLTGARGKLMLSVELGTPGRLAAAVRGICP
jgi:hypothetical protein